MDGQSHARQQHGLDFEDWVKETFFDSYVKTGNTDKWDAKGVSFKNKYSSQTAGFQGLPISMKTCKYGSSIGFADALRQLENNEDFLLIVAFWKQSGNKKNVVSIGAVKIDAKDWQNLFVTDEEGESETLEDYLQSPTIAKIRKLDSGIKDRSVSYQDARRIAIQEKSQLPKTPMSLHQKIDSKNQRRLQCSLPFSVFSDHFQNQFVYQTGVCKFWGETVPSLK